MAPERFGRPAWLPPCLLRSQRSLKLLGRYTLSCSLLPGHLRAILAIDEDELFPSRTPSELEESKPFRAILTNNALGEWLSRSLGLRLFRFRLLLSDLRLFLRPSLSSGSHPATR